MDLYVVECNDWQGYAIAVVRAADMADAIRAAHVVDGYTLTRTAQNGVQTWTREGAASMWRRVSVVPLPVDGAPAVLWSCGKPR